jgi:hypothetical protein
MLTVIKNNMPLAALYFNTKYLFLNINLCNMAKQTGPFFISGTIAGITYYQRNGQWLLRSKTSLNKKRISIDSAFANSRRASDGFGRAAQFAKKIYWQLPASKRGRGIIGKIAGRVNTMMVNGNTPEAIEAEMMKQFG